LAVITATVVTLGPGYTRLSICDRHRTLYFIAESNVGIKDSGNKQHLYGPVLLEVSLR